LSALAPLRRELVVDADPAVAFAVFTDRIGSWWPLGRFSVYGEQAFVEFRDGSIVESAPGRPDEVWGVVTAFDPPTHLSFTWHPGTAPDRASLVSVTFTVQGEQTLVQLEHSGWEGFADAGAARAEYENGWPLVLGSYGGSVPTATISAVVAEQPAEAGHDGDATWVALLHRPGPAAGAAADVTADPRFGDHVAFLHRMLEGGYLVAAGPLGDEPGAGLTILRLPGADRLEQARHLAEVDDASVATGFFTVTVRPWHVVMTS
jgi:uncharacterized protein YndB with AHSA1/START domain/uncharacterized protein YciI